MSGKKGKRIRITGLYYAKWSGIVIRMDMRMRELEVKTGVSRETIRYYIREGIVPEPERPIEFGRSSSYRSRSFCPWR